MMTTAAARHDAIVEGCLPSSPQHERTSGPGSKYVAEKMDTTTRSPRAALAAFVAEHSVNCPLVHHKVERFRLERKFPRVQNLEPQKQPHMKAVTRKEP